MIVKPLTIKYIRKFKSFFDERLSEEVLIKRVEQYYNKLNESLRIVPDEEKYIEEADTIANLLVKKCTQENSTKGSFSFKLFSDNRVTNKKIFLKYQLYINNIPDIESCITQIQLINNYYYIELSYSGKEDNAFSNISKELMKCFVKIFSAEHSNARLSFNTINMKNLNSLETYLNDLINLISREGKNNAKSALIIFLKKYDKPLKFSNTNKKDLQYNEFINKNQYLNLNKSISDIRRLMNLDSKTQKSLFIKVKQQIPSSIKDFMQLLIYLTKEIKKLDDELKDIINEYYE